MIGQFAQAIVAQQNNANGIGVHGVAPASGTGVVGDSNSGVGVQGNSDSGGAVKGLSNSARGVEGSSETAGGVVGWSTSSVGVAGNSTSGRGVQGVSATAGGVVGISTSSVGIAGISESADALVATTSAERAAVVHGNVVIVGALIANLKLFRIDHPLDPANKYLNHSVVESSDMMNIYSGNVITDGNGDATVVFPEYFSTLNRDFRYQLTVIGQFAQAIVASEIARNRFGIKTDKPNVRVSWQVTGIRQDAYALANPIQVEQEKPAKERGSYTRPELFNQPEEKGLVWVDHPELMQELKAVRERRASKGQKF